MTTRPAGAAFQERLNQRVGMGLGAGNALDLELIEVREEQQAERRIPERAFTCLLDAGGEGYDSVGFSRFLEERRMSGLDLCFVIGGPYGLELPGATQSISLGPMTLPHQLARVVLLEQLYRAHKILAGEPYHD